jgi:hypothetical protein
MVKIHRRPGVEEPAERDAGRSRAITAFCSREKEICDRSFSLHLALFQTDFRSQTVSPVIKELTCKLSDIKSNGFQRIYHPPCRQGAQSAPLRCQRLTHPPRAHIPRG